jgi:hypothetical protein
VETSGKILIVGGVAALTYAFLLGFAMARARMAAPQAPRHLVNTHLEGLILGAVLLGLAVALGFSTLAKGGEVAAASLLVAGGALSLAGGTVNWLQGVEDTFAAKSPGFLLQAVSGPVSVVGIVIVLIGVLKAL